MTAEPNRPLHWHVLLTLGATLALVGLGGLVTSHGVGMAVPDWPNTYGYNMFFFPVSQWVGGIFYEHTHRLLGSLVGFLTLVLAVWVNGKGARYWLRWGGVGLVLLALLGVAWAPAQQQWGFLGAATGAAAFTASWFWPSAAPASRPVRWMAAAALVAVIVQGLLGGLRVVLMADVIGVFHATLAQLFLVLLAVLAVFTSRWWQEPGSRWRLTPAASKCLRGGVWITTLAILGQLVLGAAMRHRHAGLAIPDFPLAYGSWWPAMDADAVARYNRERFEERALNPLRAADLQLHMAHRLTAAGILVLLTWLALRVRRILAPGHRLTWATLVWAGLGYGQLLLGAITVWTNKSADLATLHVVVGSLLLAGGGVLSVLVRALAVEPARSAAGCEVSRRDAWSSAAGGRSLSSASL